jgi:hypothetical protein
LGKSEGTTPLGTSKHIWEDNIAMDLREIGWVVQIGITLRASTACIGITLPLIMQQMNYKITFFDV